MISHNYAFVFDFLHFLDRPSVFFSQWVQQSIRNVTEDVSNQHLSYVTSEDVCGCFEGDTLLAVQAPQGTQVREADRQTLSRISKHGLFLQHRKKNRCSWFS